MPMHRKNKAPRDVGRLQSTEWFRANKKRARARKQAARQSKRRNRK